MIPVEKSAENVARIRGILEKIIRAEEMTVDEQQFWDNCYPWVEEDPELIVLLEGAYKAIAVQRGW